MAPYNHSFALKRRRPAISNMSSDSFLMNASKKKKTTKKNHTHNDGTLSVSVLQQCDSQLQRPPPCCPDEQGGGGGGEGGGDAALACNSAASYVSCYLSATICSFSITSWPRGAQVKQAEAAVFSADSNLSTRLKRPGLMH